MLLSLSLARELAYDAFVAIMDHKKKPEQILNEYYESNEEAIRRLDRNFIKEIVYGSLRWYSKLYWILQNTSKRDLAQASGEIRAALIVGTYQIYYMDRVPDRAAVNESVEYIRKKGQTQACSFVNGILRQIARRAEYFPKPDKKTKPREYLALQFAHPMWIVDRWHRRFRFERMEQMLAANNQPPPYTVRVNGLKFSIDKAIDLQDQLLRDEKTHSERRPLRSALRFLKAPDLSPESLFGQGCYTIQDEASQLIAYLVAPAEGEMIADVCAGPGGKLSQVYELGKGTLELIAIEKDAGQMLRAQQNMLRLGHERVTYVEDDFLTWETHKKPKKILLDAPCSGLGVLRRHPEGKWHKTQELVQTMAQQQWQMITHALKILPVGGELIYSVCSFELEETEDHLIKLRNEFGDKIELVSPLPRLPDYYKKYVTREHILAVYAGNQDDMDGFGAFIIRIREAL